MTSPTVLNAHRQAEQLIDAREWSQAEALLTRLVSAHPADDQAWHLLGTAQYRRGAYQMAEESFRNRLALAAQNSVANYSLAITLEQNGKVSEAQALLQRALELNPGLEVARQHLDCLQDAGVTPGVIRGVARRVQLQRRTDVWIRDNVQQILWFRVERTDDPRLPSVLVKMVGTFIDGDLRDGDRVEVRGRPRPDQPLLANTAQNLDSGLPVLVRGEHQSTLMRITFAVFMIIVVAVMAYGTYRYATAPDGPPPGFPGTG
jgi:tetratricopeptide (TPR) repeat protein